jgi:hypothetical protein
MTVVTDVIAVVQCLSAVAVAVAALAALRIRRRNGHDPPSMEEV